MVSIVVPTFRRSAQVKRTFLLVHETLKQAGIDYELIFVDDASGDETASTIKTLALDYPWVKGVVLSENMGQQKATIVGLCFASKTYAITMDDDLTVDPKGIILLLDTIKEGFDVVYGVMDIKHKAFYRHFGTWTKEMLFTLLVKKPKNIRLTSFRIMNKQTKLFVVGDTNKRPYVSGRILNYTGNIQSISVEKLTKGSPTTYGFKTLFSLFLAIFQYRQTRKQARVKWLKTHENTIEIEPEVDIRLRYQEIIKEVYE